MSERFVVFENKGEFEFGGELPFWGVLDKAADKWTSWLDKECSEDAARLLNDGSLNHLGLGWKERDITFVAAPPVTPTYVNNGIALVPGNAYYVRYLDKYQRAMFSQGGKMMLEYGAKVFGDNPDLRVIEEIVIPEQKFNTLADMVDGTVAVVKHSSNSVYVRKLMNGVAYEYVAGEWSVAYADPEDYEVIHVLDESQLNGLTKVS